MKKYLESLSSRSALLKPPKRREKWTMSKPLNTRAQSHANGRYPSVHSLLSPVAPKASAGGNSDSGRTVFPRTSPNFCREWIGLRKVRLEDLLPDLASGKQGNLSRAASYYRQFVSELQSENFTEVWNLTHTRPFTVMNYLLRVSAVAE